MPAYRRFTASFVAVTLGWALLAFGVAEPSAQAASVSDGTSASAQAGKAGQRAAHDPATYYAGTDGLTGAALSNKLNSIIKGHTTLSYGAVWTALQVTDADPDNPGSIFDFYSGTRLLAADMCNHSGRCLAGEWNREHSWAKSHGDFGTTNGPGTDLFHLRPELADVNSTRNNYDFDNGDGTAVALPNCGLCRKDSDSFEPRASIKGDVARGLFYMAVRYNGGDGYVDLVLNDFTCNSGFKAPNHGKLSTLVAWSLADPPDALESARNNLIDSDYQHNRNPFIDHPEWVTSIWGDGVGLGPACGTTGSGTGGPPGGGGTTNHAPTTGPMTASTQQGSSVNVPLVANDADNDLLTWTITQSPSSGSASVSGTTLTYTPTPNFTGSVEIGVSVSDGHGGVAATTVSVTVIAAHPGNHPPVASDVMASTPRNFSTVIGLVATDPEDSDFVYQVASPPQHGAVSISGETATYTPAAEFTGDDTFTYTASDPYGATSAPATATVTVVAVNRDPSVGALQLQTTAGTPITVTLGDLEANDPDGDSLSISEVTPPEHGSMTHSDTSLTYTPAIREGDDSFFVTVNDGNGGTATAEVAVHITARVAQLQVDAQSATRGRATTVTITATGPGGSLPTGEVTLFDGGTKIRTASLDGATATVAWKPRRAGSRSLTATYEGDDLFASATSAPATLKVAKSASRLAFSSGTLKRGHAGVVKVKVRKIAGQAASGKITLKFGSKKLTAKLHHGIAKFRIAKLPKSPKLKVVARYGGNSQYRSNVSKHAFTLKK